MRTDITSDIILKSKSNIVFILFCLEITQLKRGRYAYGLYFVCF